MIQQVKGLWKVIRGQYVEKDSSPVEMGTGLAELAWLLRSMGHLHKEKQRLPRNWGGRKTRTDGEQQKYWPYKRRLSFVCGCESQCVFLWTFVVIKHLVTWYNTSRTVHLEQWWNLSSEKQTHHHFFLEKQVKEKNGKNLMSIVYGTLWLCYN